MKEMNYFPIYLDAAAMHPLLPCAREAFQNAPFGNPSSEHEIGQNARNALEYARENIAALMECEPDEIYFTSTATEAAAMVLASAHHAMYRITLSPYEHHAVTENVWSRPLVEYVENTIGALWCRMYGNNETGAIAPLLKMQRKDLLLRDATAAVGHIPVSFKTLGCDYLLFDAIKFGGVPGAAALIAKKGAPLSPLIRGGGQERGMRSGTENVPAICAMAAALEWQTQTMEANTAKLSKLSEIMQTELSKIDGIQWNTPFDKPRLPHILNLSFTGVDAHALTLLLSKEGVMVSPGAACSNGLHEPSHVIMAMFHDEQRARSAIRISLSHENTEAECEQAANKIAYCVAYLRSLS